MEILTKLFGCCVLLVCVSSETAETECIDRWPFCHIYNPPCSNQTNQTDIHGLCPRQCGLCTSSRNDSQSADVSCKDDFDCFPFNLSEGCQSNNTWYRQYCRKSCNICLSDNETTTEGCEIRDENSTIHNGKYVLGKDRWEDDKKVISSVIGSVVVIIVVGNIIVYFIFLKKRKGLNGSHTHEGKQEQVQSHSNVQMTDNAESESCSEPSIHVYDEVGDILNETATGEQTRRPNQSQHKMLKIENVTDHSETIMYLHPYTESPYSLCRQTLEDEHPLRSSNADIDNFATSDNHEYHNL